MNFSKSISNLLFIFLLIFNQAVQATQTSQQIPPGNIQEPYQESTNQGVSLDDVFQFIDKIESENLENVCSEEDLDRINHFISLLAEQGSLDESEEEIFALKLDINDLLGKDCFSLCSDMSHYVVIPTIDYDNPKMVLCKSW